jgi:GNAT superfamily N-acetyltransferase
MSHEWRRDEYVVSTNKDRLDYNFIHEFLSTSAYWAKDRSFEIVRKSLDNSLTFGLFAGEKQIGLARVVTDYATFAWLADVFIIPEHRGLGLGQFLVESLVSHPELQGLRRWILATRDAHELYRKYGFSELAEPARWMERSNA